MVDLKARREITNGWIESRCKWTPYDGMTVTGWPVGTIIRGTPRHVGRRDHRCRSGTAHPLRRSPLKGQTMSFRAIQISKTEQGQKADFVTLEES